MYKVKQLDGRYTIHSSTTDEVLSIDESEEDVECIKRFYGVNSCPTRITVGKIIMKIKVYCNNCIHLEKDEIGFTCTSLDNRIGVEDTWLKITYSYKNLPSLINRLNDCKWFVLPYQEK